MFTLLQELVLGKIEDVEAFNKRPARLDAAPFGFVPRETFCHRFDALWWNSWSSSDSSNVRSSRLVGDPWSMSFCLWSTLRPRKYAGIKLNDNYGQLFEVHWFHPPVLVAKKYRPRISKFSSCSWAHFLVVSRFCMYIHYTRFRPCFLLVSLVRWCSLVDLERNKIDGQLDWGFRLDWDEIQPQSKSVEIRFWTRSIWILSHQCFPLIFG